MKPEETPKPEPLVIDGIPLKAFEQFESGARFSVQFNVRTPPYYKQEVILICEPKAGSAYRKQQLKTTVLHVKYLDTLLVTKNFYDVTFDLNHRHRD
tara:strand:+ start:1318 stop:1608 length:291 start_codon:yes stop_codon:yes gene_type:complete